MTLHLTDDITTRAISQMAIPCGHADFSGRGWETTCKLIVSLKGQSIWQQQRHLLFPLSLADYSEVPEEKRLLERSQL